MSRYISASIICFDHLNIRSDAKILNDIGIDYFHADIMDSKYVPRYGIYPEIVQELSNEFNTPIDVHLMVDDVDFAIDTYGKIDRVRYINFHYDGNEKDIFKYSDKIRSYGKLAGICLNLSTPIYNIHRCIDQQVLDFIVFMGIHPGVLKQTSRPEALYSAVSSFRKIYSSQYDKQIQVDGGVSFSTMKSLIDSGVNNFVCGSSTLFKDLTCDRKDGIIRNYKDLRKFINV